MNLVWGIVIGIIALTILVVLHELGHALVARRNGVRVEEFGIGFPPAAYKKNVKKSFLGKNVVYSVNWLPLGGFVKLQGEHDDDKKPGDYGAATFWQKTKILLAGVAMNWLTAAVLLTLLAWFGLPQLVPHQFTVAGDTRVIYNPVVLASIEKDLPAESAGLKSGDAIISVNGKKVEASAQLSEAAAAHKGEMVRVTYKRDGAERVAHVALRSTNDDKRGYLGAGLSQERFTRSTWSAPIVGIGVTAQLTGITLQGLGQVIGDGVSGLVMKLMPNDSAQKQANQKLSSASQSVGGPLSIFGILFPAAERAGMRYVVMMTALISLTLAVMNILPIPALDGGRWFVTAVFRLLKKPLTKEREEKIHGTGFLVLLLLVVLVTVSDVAKLL
ncbi:site-2 protease family protein [Candidatus Saccharibacteria bacterium]|nr:site-2 protease family protein [Candidatus Saccharibacteria bacterium]